jgi:predicted GNAT family acetyltransferase
LSVVRHTEPDAFLAAAGPLLARNAAMQAFVTSWTDGWRAAQPADMPPYLATYADGAARGIALQREGPLLLLNSDPAAAQALAHDLASAGRAVAHVIGEAPACAAFAAAWRSRTGRRHRVAMTLRHHMLTQLADVAIAPGAMRGAQADDLAWLMEGSLAFAHEANLPDSARQIESGVRKRFARGGFRIWTDRAPVAFAGCADAGRDARIGMVYTLPGQRGRGYATSLVAAIVRERLAAGTARLFLTTDVSNPTSNAIYARIGFRPVSDEVRLDFIDEEP